MKDWQQRVVDEKAELDAKIAKLNAFMDSEAFLVVGPTERRNLIVQEFAMCQYSHILANRISIFVD